MENQSKDKQNRSNRADGSVDDEVQKLFKKNNGKISSADFMKLRQKYNDSDLVDKIQKAYLDKQGSIIKKAKKFAQLIRDKYSNQHYPFHVLLEKARLFKVKHGLTDDEFTEFQRIYEQELVGQKSLEVSDAGSYYNKGVVLDKLGRNVRFLFERLIISTLSGNSFR